MDRVYALLVGSVVSGWFREIRGRHFPRFRFDNRHKVNVVVSRKLSRKVELNGSFGCSPQETILACRSINICLRFIRKRTGMPE